MDNERENEEWNDYMMQKQEDKHKEELKKTVKQARADERKKCKAAHTYACKELYKVHLQGEKEAYKKGQAELISLLNAKHHMHKICDNCIEQVIKASESLGNDKSTPMAVSSLNPKPEKPDCECDWNYTSPLCRNHEPKKKED